MIGQSEILSYVISALVWSICTVIIYVMIEEIFGDKVILKNWHKGFSIILAIWMGWLISFGVFRILISVLFTALAAYIIVIIAILIMIGIFMLVRYRLKHAYYFWNVKKIP